MNVPREELLGRAPDLRRGPRTAQKTRMGQWLGLIIGTLGILGCLGCQDQGVETTTDRPSGMPETIQVMLLPADGGTADGTLADYGPLFLALEKRTGINFEVGVGQSYQAVVQAMVDRKIDLAFLGPVTFNQARTRGAAELLAVGVRDGQSVYYSGIFTRADSDLQAIEDMPGHSLALGDPNSTSSFNVPVAELLRTGIDPVQDLGPIYITDSHASSMQTLASSKVDAACASLDSFQKGVRNGKLQADAFRLVHKSEAIPYPPLAIHPDLDPAVKQVLREAIGTIHQDPSIRPEMLRGYGGKQVERYDTSFSIDEYDRMLERLKLVTKEIKADMIDKAAQRSRGT